MTPKKLRILIANWTWYPSGGDWTYIENLCSFYESKGHEVIPFSMADERNFPTPYSRYFISKIDYKELNRNKTVMNGIKAVKKTIYSNEAKSKIKSLLDKHPVDIVHLNNVHHYLTPASIIPEIKKRNIPIIWTLHDYVILCPNTTFISHDTVCEKCIGGKFYHCVTNKCKKNSVAASAAAAMESYANNLYNPYKYVDYFICPSEFLKNKFESSGFHKNKLRLIYNLFDTGSVESSMNHSTDRDLKPYIIYVGNILKTKGIFTLVKAMAGLDTELMVVGGGEFFEDLKKLVESENLVNVKLMGKMAKIDVFRHVQNARFVVVPSEWYENLPYSVVEALLLAKPVLGADIGGIPELVIPGTTGELFKQGDITDLRAKIINMLSDSGRLLQMGKNAREHALKLVNFNAFGDQLSPLFQSLKLAL